MRSVAGKKAVDAAVSTSGQKVEQKVTEVVSRVVTEHIGGAARTPVPESLVPEKGVPGGAGGAPCPLCGIQVSPGTRFCGSCGVKIEEITKTASEPSSQPVCPRCGKPVIPGKKF